MVDAPSDKTPPKPPPGLIGAVLVYWGLFSGHFILGVLAALLTESHRFISIRWQLTDKHYVNYWNLSLIILFVTILIPVIENPKLVRFNDQFIWTPLAMLPILLAQYFSTRPTIPLGTFFISMRFKARKRQNSTWVKAAARPVHIGYAYFLITLLCSGLANSESVYFYFAGALLLIVASLSLRTSRRQWIPYVAIWTALLFLGYKGHLGLHQMHLRVEQFFLDLYTNFAQIDPYKSTTRIGELGKLKQSSQIVWRLFPEGNIPPVLIKEASYDTYKENHWLNTLDKKFEPLQSRGNASISEYPLIETADLNKSYTLRITGRPRSNTLYLALPPHSQSLINLQANDVSSHPSGMVRVRDYETLLNFQVSYQNKGSTILPPIAEKDLVIPENEKATITTLAETLQLADKTPSKAISALKSYFQQRYTYATYQSVQQWRTRNDNTPLTHFLTKTKSGHCEYFATATVLLLRAANIPARYAIGFSVQEYNPSKDYYFIRSLHAHAWAEAWINNQWVPVDTTPAIWGEVESENRSILQPLWDGLDAFYNGFLLMRQEGLSNRARTTIIIVIILVLLLYIPLRVLKGDKAKRQRLTQHKSTNTGPTGPDSPLKEIEPLIAQMNWRRRPEETWHVWFQRHQDKMSSEVKSLFSKAIQLHYRIRFSKKSEIESDQKALNELVAHTKKQLKQLSAS